MIKVENWFRASPVNELTLISQLSVSLLEQSLLQTIILNSFEHMHILPTLTFIPDLPYMWWLFILEAWTKWPTICKGIFKSISFNENPLILNQISLKFVPKGSTDGELTLT